MVSIRNQLLIELLFEGFGPYFRSAAVLRPFFIYGPRQRGEMLIPRLIASVRDGRPVQLQGRDGLRLSPIFVEDAAEAFAAAPRSPRRLLSLDIAGPEVLTLREIAEAIGRQVGRVPVYEHCPGSPTDYIADTAKTRARLKFGQTRFEDGLARTLAGI